MKQAQYVEHEGAELEFKRHILRESKGIERSPHADLFRVNLLGQMLDRYDELREKGIGEQAARARVRREYFDIKEQMQEMGVEACEVNESFEGSRWPQLTEDEAAQYIRESDEYLHKKALGVGMCAGCVAPIMVGAAFSEVFYSDFFSIMGLVGMFIMIALGVYAIAAAKKPEKEKTVKKGRFSLGSRLRRKLSELRKAVEDRARRRKGKGIAMLVGCIIPVFIGAAIYELSYSDFWQFMGLAGMFVMIGAGVYELVVADGEKKTMRKLLEKGKDKG